jgi:hypothetical protein
MSVAAWSLLGLAGAAAVVAVVALPKSASASSSAFRAKLEVVAKKLSADVLASARKWAASRGVPVREVVASILLESRGDPRARNKTAREDSRGILQVNVNKHGELLSRLGYKPDDLYRLDVGMEVGTALYAESRKRVDALVRASGVPQWHPVPTLTRLRYAGPKYVDDMLAKAKSRADTKHPFKDAEIYVAHWDDAMAAAGVVA